MMNEICKDSYERNKIVWKQRIWVEKKFIFETRIPNNQ